MTQPPRAPLPRECSYRTLLLNSTNLASWCTYFSGYFGLALLLSWFTPYLIKASWDLNWLFSQQTLPSSFDNDEPSGGVSQGPDDKRRANRDSAGHILWCAVCLRSCAPRRPGCLAVLNAFPASSDMPAVRYPFRVFLLFSSVREGDAPAPRHGRIEMQLQWPRRKFALSGGQCS